jgi:hypothetical protein
MGAEGEVLIALDVSARGGRLDGGGLTGGGGEDGNSCRKVLGPTVQQAATAAIASTPDVLTSSNTRDQPSNNVNGNPRIFQRHSQLSQRYMDAMDRNQLTGFGASAAEISNKEYNGGKDSKPHH